MKFFAVITAVLCLAAGCFASGYGGGAAAAGGGYGAASIPAPPCPKNYLFSCQPNLAPAPCAPAAAGGYGGAGSYSQSFPIYTLPQFINKYQQNQQTDY